MADRSETLVNREKVALRQTKQDLDQKNNLRRLSFLDMQGRERESVVPTSRLADLKMSPRLQ